LCERLGERLGERSGERFGERLVERFGERLVERLGERSVERLGERLGAMFGERLGERLIERLGERLCELGRVRGWVRGIVGDKVIGNMFQECLKRASIILQANQNMVQGLFLLLIIFILSYKPVKLSIIAILLIAQLVDIRALVCQPSRHRHVSFNTGR
jgi:hypothetical protein